MQIKGLLPSDFGMRVRYTLRIMPKSKFCEERVKLGQKISRAVLALYAPRQVDLEAARKARYDALKALQEHVKQHGCHKVEISITLVD